MVDKKYLLTSKQMASFVADGYLRFDALVPDAINQAAMPELEAGLPGAPWGTPLGSVYPVGTTINRLLAMPEVQGIIQSLVGPNPLFDHHAVHVRKANEAAAQHLHSDNMIDMRNHFDIQLMYFPHAIPLEMGGTMLVPGTHFRRINEAEIGRYQNLRGQIPMVCEAGTILVLHHGIWHCGRRNTTGRTRYMFKIRLNPTVRQLRLWNTDDLGDPEVARILVKLHPWFEEGSGRIELLNRIKLWRFLIDDPSFDADYWMTRLETKPETLAEEIPAA